MKQYTVYRRFGVEVSRQVVADNFSEAVSKAEQLKLDRWMKIAPGAELCDYDNLSGTTVCEERE